jgi:HlyD family secretion protein
VADGPTKVSSELSQILSMSKASGGRRRVLYAIVAVVVVILVAVGVMFFGGGSNGQVQFKTAEARTGDLTVTVTATGTLEPVNDVDIGTEVSGTIKTVEVDYNDRVTKGQVLARLDTAKLEAQVLQSQAALQSAEASVLDAEATVLESRNELKRLKRVLELSGGKVPSQNELDAATAKLKRAEAQAATARAQVAEAKAKLSLDQTSLDKAIIVSPIDGIVLKREIEPGQTVAASLQAPVLFTVAESLAQMELHVAVDEADVGQVREGQEAIFTVDAYADREFPAVITQVRQAPQTVEGVVTYETVLSVDNADLSLRPGMTATAEITVQKLQNVLLVPNAALRFSPPTTEAKSSGNGGGLLGMLLPRRHRPSSNNRRKDLGGRHQRVWVLQDGGPVAVAVTVGASDGQQTEVQSKELKPGTAVLVDTIGSGK